MMLKSARKLTRDEILDRAEKLVVKYGRGAIDKPSVDLTRGIQYILGIRPTGCILQKVFRSPISSTPGHFNEINGGLTADEYSLLIDANDQIKNHQYMLHIIRSLRNRTRVQEYFLWMRNYMRNAELKAA